MPIKTQSELDKPKKEKLQGQPTRHTYTQSEDVPGEGKREWAERIEGNVKVEEFGGEKEGFCGRKNDGFGGVKTAVEVHKGRTRPSMGLGEFL